MCPGARVVAPSSVLQYLAQEKLSALVLRIFEELLGLIIFADLVRVHKEYPTATVLSKPISSVTHSMVMPDSTRPMGLALKPVRKSDMRNPPSGSMSWEGKWCDATWPRPSFLDSI